MLMKKTTSLTGSDASHLTAIARRAPSAPMRWAESQGLVSYPALDWGCGRGADLGFLNQRGEAFGYDPYFKQELPTSKVYTYAQCFYVLNVISRPDERVKAVKAMLNFVVSGAKVVVCSRSDREIEKQALKSTLVKKFNDGFLFGRRSTFQKGFSKQELIAFLIACGLTEVEVGKGTRFTVAHGVFRNR